MVDTFIISGRPPKEGNKVLLENSPVRLVTPNGDSAMDENVNAVKVITIGTTATLANVASSASSVTLLASNTSRIRATIFNDSTAILYVKEGTTASTSSFTYKLGSSDTLIITDYNGRIDGIWDSATGNARVTEIV